MEKGQLLKFKQLARELGVPVWEIITLLQAVDLLDEKGQATQKGLDCGLLKDSNQIEYQTIEEFAEEHDINLDKMAEGNGVSREELVQQLITKAKKVSEDFEVPWFGTDMN